MGFVDGGVGRQALAESAVLEKIQKLSQERERLVHEEGRHGISPQGHRRLEQLDHDLGVNTTDPAVYQEMKSRLAPTG